MHELLTALLRTIVQECVSMVTLICAHGTTILTICYMYVNEDSICLKHLKTSSFLYLSDDDPVVDLVKDVHSYLILPANLQHPVIARGDSKTYKKKIFQEERFQTITQ